MREDQKWTDQEEGKSVNHSERNAKLKKKKSKGRKMVEAQLCRTNNEIINVDQKIKKNKPILIEGSVSSNYFIKKKMSP